METVAVPLGAKSYNIYIIGGILNGLASYLGEADKWFILTDDNVDRLYGEQINRAMGNLPYAKLAITAGENGKTLSTVETVIDNMLAARLTRNSGVIAFGGGVVGDIAGFCASIYMRGIRFMQIPTTLLAQVDSSVGGKTGVNVRGGKNMAGTFYQPQVVLIDPDLLRTLTAREYMAGMGEVIKYGLIYDCSLFNYIEANFDRICMQDPAVLNPLISRCCQIKAAVVGQDEQEKDLRKILNFGHTIGHALETVTNYERYLHGEAVLLGMYYESLLAKKMGLIDASYWQRIAHMIKLTGVTVAINDLPLPMLVEKMLSDKKSKDGLISFIFPTGAGQVAECKLPPKRVINLGLY